MSRADRAQTERDTALHADSRDSHRKDQAEQLNRVAQSGRDPTVKTTKP